MKPTKINTTTTTKGHAMKNEDTKTILIRKDFIRCFVHADPKMTKKKASKIYDHMVARWPEITRGGHRGLVGRLRPWEAVEHECPYCGKVVTGVIEIDQEFGRRLYRKKLYFQSWCRDCRKAGHKKDAADASYNVRINPLVDAIHTT